MALELGASYTTAELELRCGGTPAVAGGRGRGGDVQCVKVVRAPAGPNQKLIPRGLTDANLKPPYWVDMLCTVWGQPAGGCRWFHPQEFRLTGYSAVHCNTGPRLVTGPCGEELHHLPSQVQMNGLTAAPLQPTTTPR